MFSVPKTYVLAMENVCFWNEERMFLERRTYVFGTKNVECSYQRGAFQVYG